MSAAGAMSWSERSRALAIASLLIATAAAGCAQFDSAGDASQPDPDAAPPAPDATPDAPPPPCDMGDAQFFEPVSGRCYMLFADALTWDEARASCESTGTTAYLVTIANNTENNLVATLGAGASVWIGLSDIDTEGEFVWTSGEPFLYENWRGGEPNNAGGEDCALMQTSNGTWDDRGCGGSSAYVCERE